ncbi:MAG: alpha/beta hydrolase [Chloroflexi bacterium]|nr:alpha/beta hydrolase [Chloroflexota bacterium]MCI0855435.1 alpha/beta hydrolase [Chloroflexota bacterium]MCI0889539.1 alpha/beta hydrolase [Chloroflexota bacterium]
MTELTHQMVETNGINIHLVEQGEGPAVLMLHGFPESWYSWRHQLPALAEAGYHVIAPDVRGYGQSDAPEAIEAYSMKQLTADAVGILDALDVETAVVVGHDWGAPIAWNSAALYPARFRAVVGMSVPFSQRGPMPPTQMFKRVFQNNFFYILYFQEPGVAEAELEADPRMSIKKFMYSASADSPDSTLLPQKKKGDKFLDGMEEPGEPLRWLTDADLDFYGSEFERSGFRGGLNRYRNMDRDWEELPELADMKIQQPALFLAGEQDGVIKMANPEGMKELIPNLTMPAFIPHCGHWTQQEKPDEVNAALIKFLKEL